MRDNLPPGSEIFDRLPEPRPDGEALRAAIRAMRAADGMLIGVLDDDPTGSQSVHGVQVVTVLDVDAYDAALAGPAATCFVLTNSRSLGERDAVELTTRAASGLIAAASRRARRIDLISRSDSTLRGHVMAEVGALAAVRRQTSGRGVDGVLLIPAFIEAGRLTAGDIGWARTSSGLVPLGETEFARDPVFGYAASDLRDFVVEKSGGTIARADVAGLSLADIRLGGPSRVRDLLARVRGGTWVVVNATEYSDLETVACAVLLAEQAGQSFAFRTGPSFVRALSGIEPRGPLRGREIQPAAGRGEHGLIVAGSHVSQTTRQLSALQVLGGITAIELDVPALLTASGGLTSAGDVVTAAARQVAAALGQADVLLYTSRALIQGSSKQRSLAISRTVSAALARITGLALAARPAWIIAKGGITSHDIATAGLGMRRADVAGQLFDGLISVFRPVDAAPDAIGMPYVVFPGNVGDDEALSAAVAILRGG